MVEKAKIFEKNTEKILAYLYDGPKTWEDLIKALGFSPRTLAKHIKRLESEEIIKTEIDPNDRRRKIYKLNKSVDLPNLLFSYGVFLNLRKTFWDFILKEIEEKKKMIKKSISERYIEDVMNKSLIKMLLLTTLLLKKSLEKDNEEVKEAVMIFLNFYLTPQLDGDIIETNIKVDFNELDSMVNKILDVNIEETKKYLDGVLGKGDFRSIEDDYGKKLEQIMGVKDEEEKKSLVSILIDAALVAYEMTVLIHLNPLIFLDLKKTQEKKIKPSSPTPNIPFFQS